jgi:hypothetical protein
MPLNVFQRSITDEAGNVLPSASVEVRDQITANLVQLYEDYDGNDALGNPITADANGFVRFYAGTGRYRITATSGALSRAWEDEVLGTIGTDIKYVRPAAEISAGVTPAAAAYQFPFLNLSRYYQTSDGSDYSLAFSRAKAVASVEGGTIVFDADLPQHLGWGDEVEIATERCVSIIGNMHANPNANEDSRYIYPLNNITGSMIKYTSPTATLNDGGGGRVSGLAFLDPSGDIDNADLSLRRGTFTMDAAIDLEAFSLSTIEDCSFHYIRGSGVKTGLCVMSNFDNLWIRYCGDTGKPAFNQPSDASYAMQSCRVMNLRSEVNFDEPYVYVHGNTNCKDNTWVGLGFEASPTGAATGYGIEYFIDYDADFSSFIGCHFNRNGATYAMRISGNGNTVSATPGDDVSWGGFVEITGNRNSIVGGQVAASNSTISTILLGGQDNIIDGLVVYFANRIYNTGPDNAIVNTRMIECTSLGTYLIEGTAAAGRAKIQNCILRNTNAQRAVSPSGITNAAEAVITGNTVVGNAAATGINVATANQIVTDNFLDGHTNELVHNSHMADAIIERNVGFVSEAQAQAQIASGDTAVIVAHGLGFTPTLQMVRCAPLGTWGSATKWWVHAVDGTNLEIRVDIAPGGSGLFFGWSIAPR